MRGENSSRRQADGSRQLRAPPSETVNQLFNVRNAGRYCPPRSACRLLLCVVALTVVEAEVLLPESGVGDFDLEAAVGAVAGAVGGGVGDEVLRAQLLLDLGEGGGEVRGALGEEGAAAGLL